MNDLTPEELSALNADFGEIRPSRWRSFWDAHDRDAFWFVVGWAAGIVTVLVVCDVWLYLFT